jgi:hypothetical protein
VRAGRGRGLAAEAAHRWPRGFEGNPLRREAGGIAWRTVERAKTRLGVKASKASFSGGGGGRFPITATPKTTRKTPHPKTLAVLAALGSRNR